MKLDYDNYKNLFYVQIGIYFSSSFSFPFHFVVQSVTVTVIFNSSYSVFFLFFLSHNRSVKRSEIDFPNVCNGRAAMFILISGKSCELFRSQSYRVV